MHDSSRQGVAIGFFDGVHRGHQRVLSKARSAITFRSHPLELLSPQDAPRLIMTFEQREAAIRACGIEEIVALDFTHDLAKMSPEDFASRFLPLSAHDAIVYCGANWRFGNGGRGDAALLRSLGYDVRIWPFETYRGERVSSTRIRSAIENAQISDANAMLARPWRVAGRIIAGKGLGRTIGFPTVNLALDDLRLRLPRGVYVVETDGMRGVANWGIAPTMRENAWPANILEIHFLSKTALPAATDTINVDFLGFIRQEMAFSSIDALKTQIAADCRQASFFTPSAPYIFET